MCRACPECLLTGPNTVRATTLAVPFLPSSLNCPSAEAQFSFRPATAPACQLCRPRKGQNQSLGKVLETDFWGHHHEIATTLLPLFREFGGRASAYCMHSSVPGLPRQRCSDDKMTVHLFKCTCHHRVNNDKLVIIQ